MSGILKKKGCCCETPPFACGTICSRTSAWWPGGLSARLQMSFSSVTISSTQTGPSFLLIPSTNELPSSIPQPTFPTTWGVSLNANTWPYFKGASRPSDFWENFSDNIGDTDCFDLFAPFNDAKICTQIAQIESGAGNTWLGSGTPPNSEDADSSLTYTCATRFAGSCPTLTYTSASYRNEPHAIPDAYTSMTVTASSIIAMTGGTTATCSVTFPTVMGTKKIRIEGYTSVGLKIVGGTDSLTITDRCDSDTYGPYTPACGVYRYMYWFFYEGDPPDGFPCSQSSWTFSNQLTQGYFPSASTATCSVAAFDISGWSGSETCDVDNLGVFNIGSGGTVTISLTNDGCHDGPDLLSIDIQCNDAESSPATWDGPMQLVGELDIDTGDPYYEGETTLYTGSATWTGTGWDYRIVRKSDSEEMFNNVVVTGDIDDPTGTYDYDGSLWDEECGTLLRLVSTAVP